jgi:hypothetical protein
MATWRTTVILPGALGVDDEDFEHPLYVTPAEISVPFTYEPQGMGWHFPVGYDTHLNRAFFLSGFEDSTWEGEVRIPNNFWRDDNATSALSPLITFSYTVTGSVPSKLIADASITPTPYTLPVPHVGATNGLLLTNANFDGGLGEWEFGGLSDTLIYIGEHVCGSVTAYDSTNPAITAPVDMVFTLEASIRGNTSVMRVWDGAEWLYLSYFQITLIGTLSHDSIPSGYFVEGPDGSRDVDNSPVFSPMTAYASNVWSAISGSSSNTAVGTASLTSAHSLSPDPEVYEDEATTELYAVPWEFDDHTPDEPYRPLWSNVVIEISGEVASTPPDPL